MSIVIICVYQGVGVYDVEYYKEPNYLIDRNQEYSQVLAANDDVYLYGESILEKNEEKQIQGLNGSVIITVENDALRYHRYDDYGMNHSIGWGHSYQKAQVQEGLMKMMEGIIQLYYHKQILLTIK